MPDIFSGHPVLGRVHAKANVAKNECYFVGFIEGLLANRRIDDSEVEPMMAECEAFCRKFGDEDAAEILEEARLDYVDGTEELLELLTCISEVRARNIDAACPRSSANRLLGFCAGIACDGIITTAEARQLEQRLDRPHDLAADPRIEGLRLTVEDAIADEVVDPDEAHAIANWITMLVGDSYADTGIATLDAPPVIGTRDFLAAPGALEGLKVVLTGRFTTGPRNIVAARCADLGAVVRPSVTRQTDLLLVGGELARDWSYAHCGHKIGRALQLRAAGTEVKIASELDVAPLLPAAFGRA